MKRALSLAFLLLFSLPLISPLFALSLGPARLPICCRNNGAHHCEGMPDASGDHTHLASAPSRCASYPQPATPARTGALSLHTPSNLLLAPAPAHTLHSASPLPLLNAEATEGHPRGPPASLL